LTDGICEHAEESDSRKYECQYAEEDQQACIESLLTKRLLRSRGLRADLRDR
jgi:hypothetical protein